VQSFDPFALSEDEQEKLEKREKELKKPACTPGDLDSH